MTEQQRNFALSLLVFVVALQFACAFHDCFERNYGYARGCFPPRPVSYLPVPQPFPVRVPVTRPSFPQQSVTIPNIILAMLPPTNNRVSSSPYSTENRFDHRYPAHYGYRSGCGYRNYYSSPYNRGRSCYY